ncbi:MAG: fumarate reductase subunit FrdD [Myxococcota bacterium]
MKTLLLKLEPIIWLLFGQGIMIGTMLLTAWIAVVGVAIPLGIISPEALAYDRAIGLGGSLIGKIVLFGLIALPLWKGAHHMRHLSLDMGGHDRDTLVAPLLYGAAVVGSVLAVVAVIRL